MINKKGLIIICVLGFIVINLFYIDAFYNNFMGDKLYNKKGFEESIKYFDSANNLQGVYNKGNSFYKLKKYSESIGEYKSILSNKKSDLNFRLNHNIANSFYRLGEEEKTVSLKIKNWEESVKYYSDALNIKYNEETKKNLEFVLEKIKKEKKKQEEEKQKNKKNKDNKDKNTKKEFQKQDQNSQDNNKDNKKEGNSSKDSKDNKSTKGGDKKQGNNTDKNKNKEDQNNKKTSQNNKSDSQKKGDKSSLNKDNKNKQESNKSDNKQGKNTESKTNGSKKQGNNLTKDQEKALKQYEEALKGEQKKNSNDFNKVYKENNSKDPFNNFFKDPFFNNDLLNQGSGKKDW